MIGKNTSSEDNHFLLSALIAFATSMLLSYLSYFIQDAPSSGINVLQLIASLIFWFTLVAIVLRYPLRGVSRLFARYIKSVRGFLIFVAYMSVHLLVYGFILEGIVASIYPTDYAFPVQTSVVVSSSPLYPLSVSNSLLGLFIFPNIGIAIPPIFGASLSLYSIAMAIIIGILVEANIMKAIELRGACSLRKRSTAFVVLPIIGVVGGASCCLSLPIFIAFLAAPVAALASPSVALAYYITYFLFPPSTAIALKLNLDSINKITGNFLLPINHSQAAVGTGE